MGQLKMQSSDGKKYLTDVTDTEQLLRLIQSIPSKKAEPFKLWLAKHETVISPDNVSRMHRERLVNGPIKFRKIHFT
ncbi:MAG: hypothetical protein J5761_02610 [Paludibacteraceae bacterium]|nr:hypothetical protein [Paludibacteraceae bacterium]